MIQLACTASTDYMRHTAAMLHSMLENAPFGAVSVNLLHMAPIQTEDRQRMRQITDSYGATLTYLHVNEDTVAEMPIGVFSRQVWLRIFLPELMPTADKVLYLDSDLIVTDDLRPLWETQLDDHLLGAVTNPIYPFMRPHPQLDLGIAEPRDYFNSGVLLMNLDLMRRDGTVAAIRRFAEANPWIGAADQDTLNVVCRDRWLKLHPRWNVQSTMFDMKPSQLPFSKQQVAESLESPAVIHYIGASKPWHYACGHPRRELYFVHARETPWGEPVIAGRSVRNAILRRLPVVWTYRWGAAESALRSVWRSARRRIRAASRRDQNSGGSVSERI